MKKGLLSLLALIVCFPFLVSGVITSFPSTTNTSFTQEDGSLTVQFANFTTNQPNAVTGINNPEGATIITEAGVSIKSTNIEKARVKANSFFTNDGVKITFPYIPETGKYTVTIAEGALQIGSDVNGVISVPNVELTKFGEAPVPAGPKTAELYEGTGVQNGLTYSIAFGAEVGSEDGPLMMDEITKINLDKITVTGLTVASAKAGTVTMFGQDTPAVVLTFTEVVAGKYNVTFAEGALEFTVEGTEYINEAYEGEITLEALPEPTPDSFKVFGLANGVFKATNYDDEELSFNIPVFNGEYTSEADLVNQSLYVASVNSSKITVDGVEFESATAGRSSTFTFGDVKVRNNAILLTFKKAVLTPGPHTVTVAEGALTLCQDPDADEPVLLPNEAFTIENVVFVEAPKTVDVNNEWNTNNITQNEENKGLVTVEFRYANTPISVTEILEGATATLTLKGNPEVKVTSTDITVEKITQYYNGVNIVFPEIPEDGYYMLQIAANSLMLDNKSGVEGANELYQVPMAGQESIDTRWKYFTTTKEPEPEPEPEVKIAEVFALESVMSRYPETNVVTFPIFTGEKSATPAQSQIATIKDADLTKITMVNEETEEALTLVKATALAEQFVKINGNDIFADVAEIKFENWYNGTYTITCAEGAFQVMVDKDTYVPSSAFTITGVTLQKDNPDVKPTVQSLTIMPTLVKQDGLNFKVGAFANVSTYTAAAFTAFDASKISISNGTEELEIESVEIAKVDVLIGTSDGLSINVKEIKTGGTYTLTLAEGAVTFNYDGKTCINAAISVANVKVEAVVEVSEYTPIYWPADPSAFIAQSESQDNIMWFAFSDDENGSTDGVIILENVVRDQVVVKDAEGNNVIVEASYKGYQSDGWQIGEIVAVPLYVRFKEALPNGTYTIEIPEGTLTFDEGKQNAAFTGTFTWGEAKQKFAVPTVNKPSGTYPENEVVTITAGEGGYVAYSFTPATEEEELGFTQTSERIEYFVLEESGTLRVKTWGEDGVESDVLTFEYTVTPAPEKWAQPTFNVDSYEAYPAGTEIIVTAPEGAFVAWYQDNGGSAFRPEKVTAYADETEYVMSGQNSVKFTLGEETLILTVYSYGEGKENSDLMFASFYVEQEQPEKLAAPTFEPESGYAFTTHEGKVTITAPEGAIVSYLVQNADGDFLTDGWVKSETNVVEVTLQASGTIKAYSEDPDPEMWMTMSDFVEAVYTVATDSVAEIMAEFGGDIEIFDMNGVRVANADKLVKGFYLVVKNGKATKILVK